MTASKQSYQAYAAATQTVAKTKQIVMLYDGIIRFLHQAKEAIRDSRIEDRWRSLTKASEVIMGLQGCLDFEHGGDIARLLFNFYSSIDSRIFSIHRTGSVDTCNEVIAELKKMRDVWHEIDQGSVTPPTPPSNAAPSAPPDQNITLSA